MHQTLQQNKLEDADFNYDSNIFKFQPTNAKIKHFWFQILAFLFFHEILKLDKFGVLISNMRILLSNSSSPPTKEEFLVSNLGIFTFLAKFFSRYLLLHQTSQQDKFEDADFKYNISFKFHPKNTQIRHFWSQM